MQPGASEQRPGSHPPAPVRLEIHSKQDASTLRGARSGRAVMTIAEDTMEPRLSG